MLLSLTISLLLPHIVTPEGDAPIIPEGDAPITWLAEDSVVILEPWVVPRFQADNPTFMLLLYGKGCGSCQWMMGFYKEAAKIAALLKMPIKFAMMNGLAQKTYARELGVKGFPHIHVYGPLKKYGYKYTGKMETQGFIAELTTVAEGRDPLPPLSVQLNADTYKTFIQKDFAVVLFSSDRDNAEMIHFIDDVLHTMMSEEEDPVDVGILNITQYKGVAPAEHHLKQIAAYRKGIMFEFHAQTEPYHMKKELVKRSVMSSEEIDQSNAEDEDILGTYLEGRSGEDAVVGLFPGKSYSDEIVQSWVNWCYSYSLYNCAHSFDRDFAKKHKVMKGLAILWRRPDIVLLGKGQTALTTIPLKSKDSIPNVWSEKIKGNQLPLVWDFDMKNYNDLAQWTGKSIVVCYFNVDYDEGLRDTKRWMKRISTVAAKYFPTSEKAGEYNPVQFAIADSFANDDLMTKTMLSREDEEDDPVIIIHNVSNHTIHLTDQIHQEEKNMKFELYLEQVVDWYISGQLPPFYQSQEPLSKQTYPVNTVVRSTIHDVMMDETKDVVIFLTQEDCEECRMILGWLNEIADAIKEEPIKIVQVDLSKNDLDASMFSYRRAPKLYMMPGGEKPKSPVPYPHFKDINMPGIQKWMGNFAQLSFKSCSKPPTSVEEDLVGTILKSGEKREEL